MSDDKPASRRDLTRQMFEVLKTLNAQATVLMELNRRVTELEGGAESAPQSKWDIIADAEGRDEREKKVLPLDVS